MKRKKLTLPKNKPVSPDEPVAPAVQCEPPVTEDPADLTLWEHDDFRGRSLNVRQSVTNLDDVSFNDMASSAKVIGKWECFEHAGYVGRSFTLEPGSYPSLRPFGLNDTISSVRPVNPVVIPPDPNAHRYITSFGGSPDGVIPYVNLRFLPCWGTTETAMKIDEIKRSVALGIREVAFNVDQECWLTSVHPVRYRGSTQAMANMRSLCNALKDAGALGYIKVWWMIDEPGRDAQISEADFRQCALDLRTVSAEYPELTGVKYAAIYGDENDPKLAMDLMNYIGMDNYGIGAGILPFYVELEKTLAPGQSSMLVPGMYTSEGKPMVIEEFLPHMQGNPKCLMMTVFLYDQLQGGYGFNGTGPRVMAVADQIKAMNV